ncbi:L,D-transpeptidase family protein [Alloiococcus sp. CFN-8]|uniref:L,D-transpeptidase n=1 Tax=Alloiococcus sp. CFN-8 TaxID=3416081 RepID=UPI003CFB0E9F
MKDNFDSNSDNLFKGPGKFKLTRRLITEIAIAIIFAVIAISAFTYKGYIKSYGSLISEGKFSEAKELKEGSNKLNPFKALLFQEDNTVVLSSYLYSLKDSYTDDILSEESFLNIIEELKPLAEDDRVLSVFKNNLPTVKEGQELYNKAAAYYKDENYTEAISIISKISPYAEVYSKGQTLKENALVEYKSQVLAKAKELEKKEYFTKGIEELQKYLTIYPGDQDIISEIKNLEKLREDYLSKQTGATAPVSSSISALSAQNIALMSTTALEAYINTLGIESKTPYAAWINTPNQTTYIFKKEADKWSLLKSYLCSTGKESYETPKGVFTMNGDRGDSFVNNEYKDGAKYWTRFNGVYLFHSVTYDVDFKDIKDSILGEPRSHGCVRLKDEDAKWIYENLQKGTTVIVV